MGIQGLIPFLEKSSSQINVSQYAGCTVAVDAYCWLHKGAFSCAEQLARGEPTTAYVHYCMKYINMLLSHNIKPILVFDGRHLPAKANTEKKRRESRELNRRRAAELLRQDKPTEARTFLRRCIDVSHKMALALMRECHARHVDCITAPYEADAQLAYLSLQNIAQVVITEDSDLVVFGCTRVLLKMDHFGNGLLVDCRRLCTAMGVRPESFDFDKFRRMCILSGCDYLPSLPGIGLAKACRFIKRTADPDISRALTRLGSHLNMPGLTVSPEYRSCFLSAEAMFRHQPVFDPLTRCVVPLTPLLAGADPPALPDVFSPEQSLQLALGNLDPFSLERVNDWDPDIELAEPSNQRKGWSIPAAVVKHMSIWSRDYKVPLPPDDTKREAPRSHRPQSTAGQERIQAAEVIVRQLPAMRKVGVSNVVESLSSEFGFTPPVDKKHCRSKEECLPGVDFTESEQSKEHVSPVLTSKRKNPFFKKQRSSGNIAIPLDSLFKFTKHSRTVIDTTCVVQSRYFGMTSSGNPLPKAEALSQKENTEFGGTQIGFTPDTKLRDVLNISPSKTEYENIQPIETRSNYIKRGEICHTDLMDSSATNQSLRTPEQDSLLDCSKENVNENYKSQTECSDNVPVALRNSQSAKFKWKQHLHDKFGFNSVGSSKLAVKDFKNPFRKKTETVHEYSVLSASQVLTMSEESVDDPEPLGSDIDSLMREAMDEPVNTKEVDGGFFTASQSSTPGRIAPATRASETPRRIGLSKNSSGRTSATKQTTILSMFTFQSKSKIQ